MIVSVNRLWLVGVGACKLGLRRSAWVWAEARSEMGVAPGLPRRHNSREQRAALSREGQSTMLPGAAAIAVMTPPPAAGNGSRTAPPPAQRIRFRSMRVPVPPTVPSEGCVRHGDLTLLYVGITPRNYARSGRPPSGQTLRSRIRYHMNGNAAVAVIGVHAQASPTGVC